MNQGKFVQAEREYKQELAVNPAYDNAHFNLGLLYYRMGRTQEATQLWRQTLQINPEYTDAKQALETITKNEQ